MTIGHCKHGEFDLAKGCPQCIAERQAVESPKPEPEPIIVKVRYISESTGEAISDREYIYFSVEPLKVGNVVQVPMRGTDQKAVVTAIDIPESEIEKFKDYVKTIPSGSTYPGEQAPTLFDELPDPEPGQEVAIIEDTGTALQPPLVSTEEPVQEPEPAGLAAAAKAAGAEVTEAKVKVVLEEATDAIPPALITIETQVGKPAPELFQLYQEAAGLLQFAKTRTIITNEDLKPATNDLAIIATCKKAMFARKTELVGPLKAKLDLVNKAFDDIMFPVMEADRLTRGQVTTFDNGQRRKAAEAQRIEDEKLRLAREEAALTGTGEHTQELGTAQAPPPVPEHTRTDLGTLGGRTNWKARVVDFALLPDEYKLPNEPLLNSFARSTKGTRPIPGVEFYDDRIVTMRTR